MTLRTSGYSNFLMIEGIMLRGTLHFAQVILKGISQIMLLGNGITGMLFLAGIFYNSWTMGAGAITGVFTGTLTTMLFRRDAADFDDGLYGYNGALVGLAIVYFFGFNLLSMAALTVGAHVATLMAHGMIRRKWPPYTAPFIASTWIVMAVLLAFRMLPLQSAPPLPTTNFEIIPAVSKGIGQVMFQENTVSGVMFLAGILVASRMAALYALVGAALGVAIALACSFPIGMLNAGLFGFNAVLCGIAFSGGARVRIILAAASAVISTFMVYGVIRVGIISLTSPFMISTWLMLLIASFAQRRKDAKKGWAIPYGRKSAM